jgi:hypothetical protein
MGVKKRSGRPGRLPSPAPHGSGRAGGETFTSLDDARACAERWCRDVAGARIHGTTQEVPTDVFEAREKPAMRPAPANRFDLPHWTDAKVHPDHHVQVLKALYSVPTP